MANNADIQKELEAIADEFDPIPFVESIFNTIKTLQSNNGAIPNTFFETPLDVNIGEAGESKLNAFLRALGFPATRNESELTSDNSILASFRESLEDNIWVVNQLGDNGVDAAVEQKRQRLLSQDDTLNYFEPNLLEGVIPSDSSVTSNISRTLLNREQKLASKISTTAFVKMLRDPLLINSSVLESSAGNRRVQLFPLVVSADVPVFPTRRRIAPLFSDGDYIVDRTRLSRPFIEHIIHARNKAFAGQNSPLKPFLEANIENEILADTSNAEAKQELIDSLQKFNSLELQLVQKFIKTMKLSAKIYVDARNKAEVLKTKIDLVPKPKKEPNEKVGEDKTLSIDEKRDIIREVSELGSENVIASNKLLDEKINKIKAEINRLDNFLQIMPTEALKKSDEIRRLGDVFSLNNIVSDVFVAEFTSLIAYERVGLEDRLNAAKRERARVVQEYENLKRLIVYLTGEFTGLSIFDIICVLCALFTVELRYLVGLLNSNAKDRLLENDLYYKQQPTEGTISSERSLDDIAPGASSVTVSESVLKVQAEVKRYFDLVDSFIKDFETGPENKKGGGGPVAPGGNA